MLSGIVIVKLHVELPSVPFRSHVGGSIVFFLKEEVYFSEGIFAALSIGALAEHSE